MEWVRHRRKADYTIGDHMHSGRGNGGARQTEKGLGGGGCIFQDMVPWMIVAWDLCFKQNIWTVNWELDHEDSVMSLDVTKDASEHQ